MKKDLMETRALTMHYYAFLNDQDVVETIVSLPSTITDPKYIEISSNDQSLIGKKYNRQTGEFEDNMYYYAILDNNDIVTEVIALPSEVTDPKKIEIQVYDQSYVGKWYNRANGTFCEPPIHVLSKVSTGEINTLKTDGTPEDKWLHTELIEIKNKLLKHENCLYGGYKTRFELRDNQEVYSDWCGNGKRYTFNFDTGIPGYFPQKIRLAEHHSREDAFVVDLYIIKNTDGSTKLAYCDQDYLGIDSGDGEKKRILKFAEKLSRDNIFFTGFDGKKVYDEGGSHFMDNITTKERCDVCIGDFTYNENSISFTLCPTKSLIGRYTNIDLYGYVY